jgi:hypothetical protein
MTSPRAGIVDKDALEKLSNAAIDLDTRPHELVDAIVLDTDWGTQVEKLAEIIRKARRRTDGPVTGSETGLQTDSETDFSERRMRDGVSRARDGQETGVRRIPGNRANEEEPPVEARDGPETDSGGGKAPEYPSSLYRVPSRVFSRVLQRPE